jgi:hypothetical protein
MCWPRIILGNFRWTRPSTSETGSGTLLGLTSSKGYRSESKFCPETSGKFSLSLELFKKIADSKTRYKLVHKEASLPLHPGLSAPEGTDWNPNSVHRHQVFFSLLRGHLMIADSKNR